MESLTRINLMHGLSTIWSVLPFYSYAYQAITFLRTLDKKSRECLDDNFTAILNSLQKQVLVIKEFGELTAKTLERNQKYLMFDFEWNFTLKNGSLTSFVNFYEQHPNIIIKQFDLFVTTVLVKDFTRFYDLFYASHQIKNDFSKIVKILSVKFDLYISEPDMWFWTTLDVTTLDFVTKSQLSWRYLRIHGRSTKSDVFVNHEYIHCDNLSITELDNYEFTNTEFTNSVTQAILIWN